MASVTRGAGRGELRDHRGHPLGFVIVPGERSFLVRPDIWEATWHPVPETEFQRGDCNDDGNVDISDAVCILNWLFLGGATPGCIAVTNTNGDAGADLSDAVYLLGHLFLGGLAPVPPYPACGSGRLPTDTTTCETRPNNCPP